MSFKVLIILSLIQFSRAESCRSAPKCGVEITSRAKLNQSELWQNETIVTFINSSISVIPNDFFKNDSNLTELYMDFVGLTELRTGDFDGADELKIFKARGNLLQSLKKNVFKGAINLENLSLSSNQIKIVDEKAFNEMKSLKFLDLSKNLIRSLSFLSPLENLVVLQMNFNRMEIIGEKFFEFNKKLENVSLSYNRIQIISKTSFNVTNSTVKFVELLENDCVDVTLSDTNISTDARFEMCFNKLKFSSSLEIKSCENRTFHFNDPCLNGVNSKLLQLSTNNKKCEKNLTSGENLQQKYTKLQEDFKNCTAALNLTLHESLQEKLSETEAELAALQQKSQLWGYFLSFLLGVFFAGMVLGVFYVKVLRKRRSDESYSLLNYLDSDL